MTDQDKLAEDAEARDAACQKIASEYAMGPKAVAQLAMACREAWDASAQRSREKVAQLTAIARQAQDLVVKLTQEGLAYSHIIAERDQLRAEVERLRIELRKANSALPEIDKELDSITIGRLEYQLAVAVEALKDIETFNSLEAFKAREAIKQIGGGSAE